MVEGAGLGSEESLASLLDEEGGEVMEESPLVSSCAEELESSEGAGRLEDDDTMGLEVEEEDAIGLGAETGKGGTGESEGRSRRVERRKHAAAHSVGHTDSSMVSHNIPAQT
jgi:hypothetical protein